MVHSIFLVFPVSILALFWDHTELIGASFTGRCNVTGTYCTTFLGCCPHLCVIFRLLSSCPSSFIPLLFFCSWTSVAFERLSSETNVSMLVQSYDLSRTLLISTVSNFFCCMNHQKNSKQVEVWNHQLHIFSWERRHFMICLLCISHGYVKSYIYIHEHLFLLSVWFYALQVNSPFYFHLSVTLPLLPDHLF